MKNKLMCHVVAGYPSQEECVELLLKMQGAGIQTIEVQIPFSDPIADGETIMRANDKALERGMTTKKSFDLIKTARNKGLKADIYIMSYSQKLISFGIEEFCSSAAEVGAKGFIIPDLPVETEEYELLRKSSEVRGLEIVPVVSPGVSENRLKENIKHAKNIIYLTSIKGITGSSLGLSRELKQVAKEIKRQKPECKLAIGFGIGNKQDVEKVLEVADIAVLGSSVIRKIDSSGISGAVRFLEGLL